MSEKWLFILLFFSGHDDKEHGRERERDRDREFRDGRERSVDYT